MEYDGSVVIKTAIDTSGFVAGSKELAESAQQAADKVQGIGTAARNSLNKQVTSFARANDAYKAQIDLVDKLKADLEELQATKVESADYTATTAELEKVGAALDKNAAKQQKMEELYGRQKAASSSAYKSLQYDAEQLRERYEALQAKQEEMATSGARYVPADTTAAQAKLAAAQNKQETMLNRLNEQYKQLRGNISATAQAATTTATKVSESHKRMADSGVDANKKLQHHTKLSLKTILKYGLGVRSVFVLYRRLRQAAADSLRAIAKADPQMNSIVSRFLTAFAQLKADLGTMLQPIVKVVVPVMTWLLEQLHKALIAISEFFAIVAGQDYIEVATAKNVDWASSMDAVAASAKEATKALGGYDKLNVISGGGDGGAGAGAGAASAQADAANDALKYTKLLIDKNKEWIKTLVGVREEAINVAEEYFEVYDEGGLKGLGGKFLENAGELGLELIKNLPQNVQIHLNALQEMLLPFFEKGLFGGAAEIIEEAEKEISETIRNDILHDKPTYERHELPTIDDPRKKKKNTIKGELDEWGRYHRKAYDQAEADQREYNKNAQKYAKQTEYRLNKEYGYYERLAKERKELVDNGKKLLKDANKAFKDKNGVSILDVGKQFVEANKGTTNKIKTVASNVAEGFKTVFGGIGNLIVPPTKNVQEFVTNVGTSIKNGLTNLSNAVKTGEIGGKAKTIGTSIKNSIVAAFKFGSSDNVKAATELGDAADTLTRTIGTTTVVHKRIANVGSVVAKVVAGGFKVSDADKTKVTEEIADTFGGGKNTLQKRATELGKSVIAKVASGMTPTEADKETAEKKVTQIPAAAIAAVNGAGVLGTRLMQLGHAIAKKTADGAELTDKEKNDFSNSLGNVMTAVKTAAENGQSGLGKKITSAGATISKALKNSMEFSEQDGKDTANAMAKGLSIVSTEAGRKGSALYNALKGIGEKISQGIENGTVPVPVTTNGTKTPVGSTISKVIESIQSRVNVYLDGKLISETVFDEAKKKKKQTGTGAQAAIEWLFG